MNQMFKCLTTDIKGVVPSLEDTLLKTAKKTYITGNLGEPWQVVLSCQEILELRVT